MSVEWREQVPVEPDAKCQAVGRATFTVVDRSTNAQTRVERDNTVLNVGREALLRQLSNSYTGAYFAYVVFGNGGATDVGGVRVPETVAKDRTALFGTEVDRVPVVCSLAYGTTGLPYVIVSGVLGSESPANGSWVSETALVLGSDVLYAMVTWAGVMKTSASDLIVDWQVYFM